MNIFWDKENQVFLRSEDASQELQGLELKMRDLVPITLYILVPGSTVGVYDRQEAPAGSVVVLSIKQYTDAGLLAGPLAFQATWVLTGTEVLGTALYNADLNLNTTELVAAMGTELELDLRLECTFEDGAGNNRDSTQLALTVVRDVHLNTDAPPSAVAYGGVFLEFMTHQPSGIPGVRMFDIDGKTIQTF